MSQDPIVIYATPHLQQAYLLRQTLADLGIEARVESPVIPQHGLLEYSESTRVVVRRQDAEEARRVALEFDELLRLPTREDEPPMTKSTGEIIEAWPRCPECDTPRMAECLICGGAQDFFPSAYQHDGAAHNLRLCPTCDDVSELRFARRCHRCSHDYGAGYEPEALPQHEDERRAWAILWVMLAGGAGLAGYFYFLFRR